MKLMTRHLSLIRVVGNKFHLIKSLIFKKRIKAQNKVTSDTGIWTELNPKVPRVDYLGFILLIL